MYLIITIKDSLISFVNSSTILATNFPLNLMVFLSIKKEEEKEEMMWQ